MGFANIELFRKITPFTENEISDDKLQGLLSFIDPLISKSFAKRNYLELLTGNVDDSNNIFYAKNVPIANINGVKRTDIDDCDVTTGWAASLGGGTIALEEIKKRQGSASLQIPKSGTTLTRAAFRKTISSTSFRKKIAYLFFYVDDKTALDKLSKNDGDLQIRFFDGMDYFQFDFGSNIKTTGWHILKCNLDSPTFQSGSPNIDAITEIYLHYTTNAKTDTFTTDDIVMDYWYSEGHLVDNNDVQIFYATQDDNNTIVMGSPQPVTSVDAVSGRFIMDTAPTSITAERGIYSTYYTSPPDLNYDLIVLSATYLMAHYASFVISGRSPNYTEIREAFMRRDTTGQREGNWLAQSIEIMNQAVGFDNRGVGFRNVCTKIPDEPVSKLGEIQQSDITRFNGGGC